MRTITIGRSSQCDIILSDDNISRIHAEISLSNGQYECYRPQNES
jgi:pSer/pThr/pTyr-binding forkhead associated (FHA) protein